MSEALIPQECHDAVDRACAWMNPIVRDTRIRNSRAVLVAAMDLANEQIAATWPEVLPPYQPHRSPSQLRYRPRALKLLRRLGYLDETGQVPL